MATNNPMQKSLILDSSVKLSQGCQFGGLGWAKQKIQEPLPNLHPEMHSVKKLIDLSISVNLRYYNW